MKTQSPLFREQSEIIRMLRSWFFFQRHFTEVSTPIRVLLLQWKNISWHLSVRGSSYIHLQFAMKRIVSSGLHRIFQIAHCFRKEEIGIHHNSEFRMLEWYTVGVSMDQFLDDTGIN